MAELHSRKVELQKEITNMELQLTNVSSYSTIEGKATELGFVEKVGFVNTIKSPSYAVLTQDLTHE